MNTSVIPTADVAAFVAAVRDELADLPAEEVEDLTSGMEADLSELASEAPGDVSARLGTPAAYAAELRAAAGLPPAGGPQKQGLRATLSRRAAQWRAEHPSIVATAQELRPAWWLARGGLIGLIPYALGRTGIGLLFLLACVVASLWLGLRNRRAERAGHGSGPLKALATVATVVSVLAVPTAAAGFGLAAAGYGRAVVAISSPDNGVDSTIGGIYSNGRPINQIFAYDINGNRIDRVRLIDDLGQPLTLSNWWDSLDRWKDSAGAISVNVFPNQLFTDNPDPWRPESASGYAPPEHIDPLVTHLGIQDGSTPSSMPSALPTSSATDPAPSASASATSGAAPSPTSATSATSPTPSAPTTP